MRKSLTIAITVTVTMLVLLVPAMARAERTGIAGQWRLTPEADRDHPPHKALVLLAQEKMTVVTCNVYYAHSRDQFVTSTGEGNGKGVKGGTIEVALEVVSRSGSKQLDRRVLKKNKGFLGWVDSSGHESGDRDFRESNTFPLELKSGEAVLFSWEFKGMPRVLGVERGGGKIRYDNVGIYGECSSCGSNDFPCP